ncbi:MAG: hypothetical protein K1X70_19390 [Leptospirales bacterium]|nr:hypothetical protein [Leptospirales bacterium]HNN76759.1 hypothetical protein [Leptospiraceae bacterium]
MKKISAILSIAVLAFTMCSPKARVTTLDGFLQRYSQEFLKGSPYKLLVKDDANGFAAISHCVGHFAYEGECADFPKRVDAAMWRTATGDIIWGVYQYGCGGGGCWGDLDSLRFYDTSLRDITPNVYDRTEVDNLATAAKIHDPNGVSLPADKRNFMIDIPRVGTTIKMTVGVVFIDWKEFAELQFDKTTGKFRLVAK